MKAEWDSDLAVAISALAGRTGGLLQRMGKECAQVGSQSGRGTILGLTTNTTTLKVLESMGKSALTFFIFWLNV